MSHSAVLAAITTALIMCVKGQATSNTAFSQIISQDSANGKEICAYCVSNSDEQRVVTSLRSDDRAEIEVLKRRMVLLQNNIATLFDLIQVQAKYIKQQNETMNELVHLVEKQSADVTDTKNMYNVSRDLMINQMDKLTALERNLTDIATGESYYD